jgi:CheY-like chemotaxis protein
MNQTLVSHVPPSSTRRILVVEDEGNQAFILRSVLRKLPSCEVTTAASGEQALRLFEQQPFDLLVTDLRMPGMDGISLAQAIRSAYPKTAIILITAFGNEQVRQAAERLSVAFVLDKPVETSQVRTAALDALNMPR